MRRNREVVLSVVAAAYGLSAMGDQMAMVVLVLRLHDQGRSGAVISTLVVASVLPIVVVGPLAAPLVDRVESGRLVAVVAGVQAVVALGLVVVTNVVGVIVLLALLGAGLAVVSPTLQLLVPEIVGDAGAARGYARMETLRSIGNAAGPAAAGLAVAGIGARVVLLGNVVSYAAMSVAFVALRIRREPVSGGRSRPGWLGRVREGVGVLGGDRVLRVAIPTLAAAVVFTAILNVARVFFVRDDLHADDAGYGWLVSAHMVGMLVAAAFVAGQIPPARQPVVLLGAGILMGCCLLITTAVTVFAVAFAAFVLMGVSNVLANLAIRNLIHARVPPETRGRAFATSSAGLNAANLTGTAVGGPLTTALGGADALRLAGAGTLLVSLAAIPLLPRHLAADPIAPTSTPRPTDAAPD